MKSELALENMDSQLHKIIYLKNKINGKLYDFFVGLQKINPNQSSKQVCKDIHELEKPNQKLILRAMGKKSKDAVFDLYSNEYSFQTNKDYLHIIYEDIYNKIYLSDKFYTKQYIQVLQYYKTNSVK